MRATADAFKGKLDFRFRRIATGLSIAETVELLCCLGLLLVVHAMIVGVLLFFGQRNGIELHKVLAQVSAACLCQSCQEKQPLAVRSPHGSGLAEQDIIISDVMLAASGCRRHIDVRTQIAVLLGICNPLAVGRECAFSILPASLPALIELLQ